MRLRVNVVILLFALEEQECEIGRSIIDQPFFLFGDYSAAA